MDDESAGSAQGERPGEGERGPAGTAVADEVAAPASPVSAAATAPPLAHPEVYVGEIAPAAATPPEPVQRLAERLEAFLAVAAAEAEVPEAERGLPAVVARVLADVARVRALVTGAGSEEEAGAGSRLGRALGPGERESALLAWAMVRSLGLLRAGRGAAERTAAWLDAWRLGRVVERELRAGGLPAESAEASVQAIRLLLALEDPGCRAAAAEVPALFAEAAASEPGRTLLGIHAFDGEVWLRREGIDELARWLLLAAALDGEGEGVSEVAAAGGRVLAARAARAGYRLEPLLAALAGEIPESA
jgi:hypothetical protein